MTGAALISNDPRHEGKRQSASAGLWAAQQEGLDNKNTFPGLFPPRPCPWSQKVPIDDCLLKFCYIGQSLWPPKHWEFDAEGIKLVCLPPDTAPLIQPPGQRIRRTIQTHYTLYSTESLVNSTLENPTKNLVKVWELHHPRCHCCSHKSCDAIKPQTVNSCWRKPCPDAVHDFTGFTTEPIKEIMKEIVDMANKVGPGGSGGWRGGNG